MHALIERLDLTVVTLVGSSMGGGEVARYISRSGTERLHSVVFASSVTPYLLHTADNPDGPLTKSSAGKSMAAFAKNLDAFHDREMTEFFSANGKLVVSESQRQEAL